MRRHTGTAAQALLESCFEVFSTAILDRRTGGQALLKSCFEVFSSATVCLKNLGQKFLPLGDSADEIKSNIPGHDDKSLEARRLTLADGSCWRLEELASGTALGYWARHALAVTQAASSLRGQDAVDGKAVGAAALAGDGLALAVVRQAGEWLGLGLVNLLHLFNPAAVVIGGGAVGLGALLLGPARAVIRQRLLHAGFYDEGLVRPAALGEDVCLVGAALHSRWRAGRMRARDCFTSEAARAGGADKDADFGCG